jgi:hypothetical protein
MLLYFREKRRGEEIEITSAANCVTFFRFTGFSVTDYGGNMLRNFKTKAIFLVLAGVLISGSAAMAETACVHLTMGVSPTVVSRGDNVKVTAAVQNCSTEDHLFTIHFKGKGPCDYAVGLGTVYMGFPAGGTRSAALSFRVPQAVCTGTATITARVYYDGVLIATSSTALQVQ